MLRATTIVRKPAVRPEAVVDTVILDHAGRQATRGDVTGQGGLSLTLALATSTGLDDGDALRLDDGRLVAVRAAPEPLIAVRAENQARLMRLAWQLGGNHVAAEIGAEVLYVPADAAVAELVRGQGCTAEAVTRAFRPERPAHDHGQCGHDHAHGHHAHAGEGHRADAQGHAHANHDHGHGHVHGPDGKHDH